MRCSSGGSPHGYVPIGTDPLLWLQCSSCRSSPCRCRRLARISKQTRDCDEHRPGRILRPHPCGQHLSENSPVVYRHALRNAAVPILTVIGLVFVGALSGTVAVESIFAIPGLGSTAVQATAALDLPLIQGVVVYFTLIAIGVNLIVDLAYGYFNPRVRAK